MDGKFPWEKASWIAGVLSAIIAIAALVYTWHHDEKEAPKPQVPSVSQTAGDKATQIGNVFGNVTINPQSERSASDEAASHISDHLIYRGINEAFVAYNEHGMVGMNALVQTCYQKIKKKSPVDEIKHCLAQDLTGLYWDSNMASVMNFPRYDYFTDANVNARVAAAFAKIQVDKQIWQVFVFKAWVPKIQTDYKEIAQRNILDAK